MAQPRVAVVIVPVANMYSMASEYSDVVSQALLGSDMPRDADQQAAWDGAVAISSTKLRAGDLLFFCDSADHMTHTGMFIGHGQFIHDTTYGHPGVQISRLGDQPWNRLLVACRGIK